MCSVYTAHCADIAYAVGVTTTAATCNVLLLLTTTFLFLRSFTCNEHTENGDKAKHCVLQMAQLIDPELKVCTLSLSFNTLL
jgi:hypothetical protein